MNGCTELNDEVCTGRPSIITEDTMVEQDRRVTVTKIEHHFRKVACDVLSHGTVLTILYDHLGVRKLCSRWVPKLLDDERIKNHTVVGLDFLFYYYADGEDFLDRIVTLDEKWVYHYTPKMKNVSKEWVAGEDPPLKGKHG